MTTEPFGQFGIIVCLYGVYVCIEAIREDEVNTIVALPCLMLVAVCFLICLAFTFPSIPRSLFS